MNGLRRVVQHEGFEPIGCKGNIRDAAVQGDNLEPVGRIVAREEVGRVDVLAVLRPTRPSATLQHRR